jgi:hypothetical protein
VSGNPRTLSDLWGASMHVGQVVEAVIKAIIETFVRTNEDSSTTRDRARH